MKPALLAAVLAARAEGRPAIVATRLADGRQSLLPDPDAPIEVREAGQLFLAAERSGTVTAAGAEWFVHVFAPPARLLIVGAVHVAQALAPLAKRVGFGVAVCDPRAAFATAERFPDVTLLTDWPDEAIDGFAPDSRTAIVTLSHDPKLDDPALDRALRSPAFHIGALGSRRTHVARLERLGALGHAAAALARIRGPVGLAIGAVTAPEIAVAILAELVAARRGALPP